jgi:hypothetical protein
LIDFWALGEWWSCVEGRWVSMGFPFPFSFFSCLEMYGHQSRMWCNVRFMHRLFEILSFELILSFARIGLSRGLPSA